METTLVCWGYIGLMEKKKETTIVYWGLYTGVMEKNMEATILGLYRECIVRPWHLTGCECLRV